MLHLFPRFFGKRLLLVCLLATGFFAGRSQAQQINWEWVRAASAPAGRSMLTTAATADAQGRTFVVGQYTYALTLDATTTLTATGTADAYVACYDSLGAVVWARSIASNATANATSVATDAAGNVYVGGEFFGVAGFGNGVSLSATAGATNGFVVCYTPAGTATWAAVARSSDVTRINALAVDASGSVRAAGEFRANAQLGSATLSTGSSDNNGFVARLMPTGQWQWAQGFGGPTANDAARAVAVDAAGNTVVTGFFLGAQITAGPFTLTNASTGSADLILAKYDPAGTIQWAVRGGSTQSDYGNGVVIDAAGAITVAGQVGEPAATFGNGVTVPAIPVTASQAGDILLVRYNAAGQAQWARRTGSTSSDLASAVAIDPAGDLYVAGSFQLSQTIGADFLSNRGGSDALVVKYSGAAGAPLWARSGGGTNADAARGIALGPDNRPRVAGSFQTRATFGSTTVTGVSTSSFFVARLSNCTAPTPVITASATTLPAGQPLTLTVSNPQPNTTYTWSGPGLTASSGVSATATPTTVGTQLYGVLAVSGPGCRGQAAVSVLVTRAGYCTANLGGAGCDLRSVELLGTTLRATQSACAFTNNSQYSSYPASGATTGTVERGASYTLRLVTSAATALGAWFDTNHNGLFEAAEYQALPAPAAGRDTTSIVFTVPTAAELGPTTLRLRTRQSGALTAADACQLLPTGETRDYVLTVTPSTNASSAAPYCAPVGTALCGSANLTRVRLAGTLDNASACSLNAAGLPYTRYPASGSTTATVVLSSTYSLAVQTSASASVSLWVDWNHDGLFATTEWTSVQTSGTSSTIALAIPPGALAGPTRLRLRSRAAGAANGAADACTAFDSGETEDYELTVFDPSPAWTWARKAGSTGAGPNSIASDDDEARAVAVDASGNVFIAGSMWGGTAAPFGSVVLPASSLSLDGFLAKYDSTGNCLWARRIGGTNGSDATLSLATDAQGNVYVGGFFFGNMTVGPFALTGQPGSFEYDLMVVKYDSNGTPQWAVSAGGPESEQAGALAVRGNTVYVGGYFRSPSVRFGNAATLTHTGTNADGFLAALDAATGQWRWATRVGGTDSDILSNVSVGPQGELYASGYFQSAVDFGSTTLTSLGDTDAFLARFDPATGAVQWARQVGGAGADYLNKSTTDADGNLYVTGTFYSPTLTFAGTGVSFTAPPLGGNGLVLAKYSPAGQLLWAVPPSTIFSQTYGNGVGVDRQGNVFVGGTFVGVVRFGTNELRSTATSNAFVAKFDAAGRALWGRASLNAGNGSSYVYDAGYDLALTPAGDAYVAGTFTARAVFSRDTLSSIRGDYDIFLAKLRGGCSAPLLNAGPDQQSCATVTATLGAVAQPGLSYYWTAAPAVPGFPSTAAQPTVTLPPGPSPTTYTFTLVATSAGGCTSNDQVRVFIDPTPPQPVISATTPPTGGVVLTSFVPTGNQWYLNGVPIPGATAATYLLTTAAQNGTYTVQSTNSLGCASGLSAPYSATVTAALTAVRAGIRVFPNPVVDGRLYLELPARGVATAVALLDVTGRVIRQAVVPPAGHVTQTPLWIGNLPHGVYLLRLQTGPETLAQQVVVN